MYSYFTCCFCGSKTQNKTKKLDAMNICSITESEKEKEDKRPESTAIRRRRINRERRSTGIAAYTPEVRIITTGLATVEWCSEYL